MSSVDKSPRDARRRPTMTVHDRRPPTVTLFAQQVHSGRMTATPGAARKDARLAMRLTPDQDALIRDAAAITGQSLTEFMTTAAVARAETPSPTAASSGSMMPPGPNSPRSSIARPSASLSWRSCSTSLPCRADGTTRHRRQGTRLRLGTLPCARRDSLDAGCRRPYRRAHPARSRTARTGSHVLRETRLQRSPTDPLHLYLLLADARKSFGG